MEVEFSLPRLGKAEATTVEVRGGRALKCPSFHEEGKPSFHDLYATCLAVHIRVGLLRGFCELTVFDARLYIRVRRVDQPA